MKHLPNVITSFNLLCGCLSIVSSFEGYYLAASLFVFAAVIFDFLDGFAARALKAYSELGKQLDSLADLVSFGVAPAFIVYSLIKSVLLISEIIPEDLTPLNIFYLVSPFAIPVFSALRLAKFNIDPRQLKSFIGLPTPANAILFASLPLIMILTGSMKYYFLILNLKFLIPLIYIQSFLLVSPIPMFSLKLVNFRFRENYLCYIFIALSLSVLFIFGIAGILLSVFLYIIMNIVVLIFSKTRVNSKNIKNDTVFSSQNRSENN